MRGRGPYLLLAWLLLLPVLTTPASAASRAPTAAEAVQYTRPLVRARLRLPESLKDYTVAAIVPVPEDPDRYAVTVRFRARTPFGAETAHEAGFRLRAAADGQGWIVTAD